MAIQVFHEGAEVVILNDDVVSLETAKYKKLVIQRLAFWWVWWVVLLFCVIGWGIDLFIGFHPFSDALIIFIGVSIVVLIHEFPSSLSIMEKDQNNPKRRLISEIALLEINRTKNETNLEQKQRIETLEKYKKELEDNHD